MVEEMKNNEQQEEFQTENLENLENGTDAQETEQNSNTSTKERTFTQSQVNRMMAREKNQGRKSVYNELGLDPENKKMIQMFKSFIESQKTDEQKEADRELETQQKLLDADRRVALAEAKAEAMMAGIKPQYVEDAVTLALAKSSDDSDLKTVFGEFKTKYPIWYADEEKKEESKSKTAGQRGTGTSIKGISESKANEKGIGARLAAQRKNQLGTGKKSFWS